MSGGRGWTIRRHSLELWPDLVLHGIGKSTFQHLTVTWLPKNWAFSAIYWAFSAIPIYWECNGVLGYSDLLGMQWRSHLLGVPMSGRSDEWKSRCNVPPGGGTLHLHIFSDGLGIDDRASMIGKVGAMCRLQAAHCTSKSFPMDWASMIGHR